MHYPISEMFKAGCELGVELVAQLGLLAENSGGGYLQRHSRRVIREDLRTKIKNSLNKNQEN